MSEDRMIHVGRLAWLPSGRTSKWLVVLFWLAVVVVAFSPAGKLSSVQENNIDAWLPSNVESTEALALQAKFGNKDAAPAILVYHRSTGITPGDQAAVQQQISQMASLEHVAGPPTGPFPSRDGSAITAVININPGAGGWAVFGEVVQKMRAIAATAPAGLDHYVTGPAGVAADNSKAFEGIDGKLLYSAGAVVIVILLLTYRSPVLWLLPVASVVVALFAAEAVIYLLAAHAGLTVNAQSQGILGVLVFGAGTDYALLLVARYREELRRHKDRHEAMAFALHRAGPAIFASGSTVVAGMLCLLAAAMNSTSGLGPVAAIGVVVALAVMLTLLPAMLVIAPRWFHWPVHPDYGTEDLTRRGLWSRVGTRIANRPRAVWVGTSLVLAAVSLGVLQLNAVGLSTKDSFVTPQESVTGQQVLAEHFPGGSGAPVVIVGNAAKAEAIGRAAVVPGIATVGPPQVADGTVMIQATLTAEPDSQAAQDTVRRVRDAVHAVPGANALVGGNTALTMDIKSVAARDNRVVMPLILLVVFLILAGLLRAVVAPVILIATVVLSFFAALGLSALLFRHVFGWAGADPGMPLFAFVFLVALGIDYNIFLMTRVREEAREIGTREGALVGLAATGGVITSAGLVLAGTFSVLATMPVVTFAEIGLVVAIGVLLDTVVVRAVLVTALNLDVGAAMWWPSRLARQVFGQTSPAERPL